MSLVIRLSRSGRKHESKYRIVVKEKRSKRDGAAVDIIGYYEIVSKAESVKKIDQKKLKYWLSVGAIPSAVVAKII